MVVLPGPELEAKPIDNRLAPLVLRVIPVEAAEEGFRYHLEYTGLEPGRFDLRDYLRARKDRATATGLPPIRVTVQSILPPGKAGPSPLDLPSARWHARAFFVLDLAESVPALLLAVVIVLLAGPQQFWRSSSRSANSATSRSASISPAA